MRVQLRRLPPLLAATMLLATGCAALDPQDDGPNTLVIHTQISGTAPGAEVFNAVVADFQRQHPEMHVKVVSNADDLPQVYETSRLAGKEADVVIVNLFDKTLEWTGVGATVPVGKYADAWGLRDRIEPEAVKQWTDGKGRLRGLPYIGTNWPVAYNMAVLRKAGVAKPPATTGELLDAAKKVKNKGGIAVTIGGSDWTGQKLLLQILQSYLPPEEGPKLFTEGDYCGSPAAMKGLKLFTELRDAGVFAENAQGLTSDTMTTQYNTGQAAAMSAMSSALGKVPEKTVKDTVVSGWPVPKDGVHDHPTMIRSFTAAGLWLSPNGAKKLPLVKKFVQYMYSEKVVDRFISEAGRDMAVRSGTVPKDFPLIAAARKAAEDKAVDKVMLPDVHIPGAATQPLINATAQAFAPGRTPQQICRAMSAAYERTN
ncbi:ABC transporter substrate-binding protein [Streptomyces pathocidini]|uniref:ABC transporter substrate-binding protein n=1 Tax=Streptomyces pathocidini TaxID=1650571 RepID=UPI003401CF9F